MRLGPLLLLLLLILTNSLPLSSSHAKDRLYVVATIQVLESIVKEIGGDRVKVESLVPLGHTPHTWVLTSRNLTAIRECDLLVAVGCIGENGPCLENAFWSPLHVAEPIAEKIRSGRYLAIENYTKYGLKVLENLNPHIWMDPENLVAIARAVADALSKLDPEGSSYYMQRLEHFTKRVEEFKVFVKSSLKALNANIDDVPVLLVVGGPEYFIRWLNMDVAFTLVEHVGEEVSAARIAQAIKVCRERGVKLIIHSVFASRYDDVVNRIARETGAVVVELHQLPISASEGVIEMLYNNYIKLLYAIYETYGKGCVFEELEVHTAYARVYPVTELYLAIALALTASLLIIYCIVREVRHVRG